MNPIDPYATSMAVGPHETGGAIGLADRVLAQRRMAVPTEPTIKSTQDNLVPLPEPVYPSWRERRELNEAESGSLGRGPLERGAPSASAADSVAEASRPAPAAPRN